MYALVSSRHLIRGRSCGIEINIIYYGLSTSQNKTDPLGPGTLDT